MPNILFTGYKYRYKFAYILPKQQSWSNFQQRQDNARDNISAPENVTHTWICILMISLDIHCIYITSNSYYTSSIWICYVRISFKSIHIYTIYLTPLRHICAYCYIGYIDHLRAPMQMTAPNGLTLAAPGMTPNTWMQSPMPLSNMPGAVLCAVQADGGIEVDWRVGGWQNKQFFGEKELPYSFLLKGGRSLGQSDSRLCELLIHRMFHPKTRGWKLEQASRCQSCQQRMGWSWLFSGPSFRNLGLNNGFLGSKYMAQSSISKGWYRASVWKYMETVPSTFSQVWFLIAKLK